MKIIIQSNGHDEYVKILGFCDIRSILHVKVACKRVLDDGQAIFYFQLREKRIRQAVYAQMCAFDSGSYFSDATVVRELKGLFSLCARYHVSLTNHDAWRVDVGASSHSLFSDVFRNSYLDLASQRGEYSPVSCLSNVLMSGMYSVEYPIIAYGPACFLLAYLGGLVEGTGAFVIEDVWLNNLLGAFLKRIRNTDLEPTQKAIAEIFCVRNLRDFAYILGRPKLVEIYDRKLLVCLQNRPVFVHDEQIRTGSRQSMIRIAALCRQHDTAIGLACFDDEAIDEKFYADIIVFCLAASRGDINYFQALQDYLRRYIAPDAIAYYLPCAYVLAGFTKKGEQAFMDLYNKASQLGFGMPRYVSSGLSASWETSRAEADAVCSGRQLDVNTDLLVEQYALFGDSVNPAALLRNSGLSKRFLTPDSRVWTIPYPFKAAHIKSLLPIFSLSFLFRYARTSNCGYGVCKVLASLMIQKQLRRFQYKRSAASLIQAKVRGYIQRRQLRSGLQSAVTMHTAMNLPPIGDS